MSKMYEEIYQQPGVLLEIEKNNEIVLKDLVSELNERKIDHVVLAARGSSDHAAIFGQYLMSIYKGAVCSLAQVSTITIYNSQLSVENDLIIGVSQSGKAEDVLAIIEQGNKKGAVTVAITNDVNAPMTKAAKYHLYCSAGVEESVAATKTFTAQMYILALLTAYWSENNVLLSEIRNISNKAKEY